MLRKSLRYLGASTRLKADEALVARYTKKAFGVSPRRSSLYALACCQSAHREVSYRGRSLSNERLEYLGDAVIELIVSDYLYRQFSEYQEGALSRLRARIVSRDSLNRIGEELGLYALLEKVGLPATPSKNICGNTLEALFGAIYIDRGFRVAFDAFVRSVLRRRIDWNSLLQNQVDHKTKLLQWAQRAGRDVRYITEPYGEGTQRFACRLYLDGKCVQTAIAGTKKAAEKEACRILLEEMNVSN